MATFYARYPASASTPGGVEFVQGTGAAGAPLGGILSVQGVAGGTAIPISGSITATNPSVGTTGATTPTSATLVGAANGGNLVALAADSSSRLVVAGAGTAGSAAGGVVTVQGSASGTAVPVSGTVAVNNFPATQPVSGTVTATQSGTWTVGVSAGTALIGKVGIDQTTPGTTNNVTVSAVAAVTTSSAVWQAEGAVAFGSLTASYVTLITPAAATKVLQMRNNTNAAVSVSFDAGTTTNFTLDSGDAVSVDYLANSLSAPTAALQVKYAVGAPTSGSFRVNCCH